MSVSSQPYLQGIRAFHRAELDWSSSSNIRLALVANTYSPSLGSHASWSNVASHEVSGSGYSAGGTGLGSISVSVDPAGSRVDLLAANVEFVGISVSARYAVVYNSTPVSNEDKHLILLVNFGGVRTISNDNLRVIWSEGVVLRIQS